VSIAPELKITPTELASIYRVAIITGKQINCDTNKIKDLVSELKKRIEFKNVINEESENILSDFFSKISENITKNKEIELDDVALNKSVAILKVFSISPILKFRRNEEIDDITKIDVSSYNPKFDIVDAFLVEVAANTTLGAEYFSFQATKKDIDQIKILIEIAEKEMKVLKKNIVK
jgi:hypothetical protein